ncbi:MAG: hypothetical protein AB1428_13170, partial [Bacteroidota bacterium]
MSFPKLGWSRWNPLATSAAAAAVLVASPGNFALTGSDVALRVTRLMSAAPANFSLSAQDAALK